MMIIILVSSSCGIEKKLNGGRLLVENKINIESKSSILKKRQFKQELSKLIKQRPNGTLIGFPKEYLGEAPVIFNAEAAKASAQNIKNYLRNKKGYYHADVTVDSTFQDISATVEYNVIPRERYKIGTITYHGKDKKIIEEIHQLSDGSLLKEGNPVDATTFYNELNRVTLALQNKGYANFAAKYFKIRGDSSFADKKIDIFLEVLSPLPDSTHTQFTIGDVDIYTDYHRSQQDSALSSTIFDRKTFRRESSKFIVKPATLGRLTFLEKGKLYKRTDHTKTFRKLSGLGTYKFASIVPSINPVHDSILDYKIYLSPHLHKWVAEFGAELFYSSINQNANQLLGTNFSTQFSNRNFLGGGEQFTIGSDIGFEFQVPTFKINSVNGSLNANLEIPKQEDIFHGIKLLQSIGLLSKKEYNRFRDETTTNIGLRLGYFNTVNLFSISSASASFSYDYKRTENTRYLITTLGIDLNRYTLKDAFLESNRNNQFLLNTFENNLITGFLLKSVSYLKNTPRNSSGMSKALILSAELSGWEKSLLNTISNAVFSRDDDWSIGGLAFAQYVRLEADQRWYQEITPKSTLAMRIYGGIIMPFGYDNSPPYVRQFNVGGPNSIRAWDQRELGPGGNAVTLVKPVPNQIFYQQGDVKLEFNIEYRFPLIWLLEGALFLDGGNVWTLREDLLRPRSQFTSDFYKQIALGFGYGLRFDFNYFNIRFDFGYKFKNPYNENDIKEILQPYYNDTGLNGYWYNWSGIRRQGFGNFQVAINYPF